MQNVSKILRSFEIFFEILSYLGEESKDSMDHRMKSRVEDHTVNPTCHIFLVASNLSELGNQIATQHSWADSCCRKSANLIGMPLRKLQIRKFL
jgi:hypothetical protein